MLIIRSSGIHEAGCYTTARIRRGARVIEYTGPRVSKKEGDRRYERREHTFLFGMRDGKTLIDGYGMAAFINHSCDANCETDEVDGRIWIIAARSIAAGEELSYDYNLYDGTGEAPCTCGAANCRGSLYEPGREPWRKKNKRKMARGKEEDRKSKDRARE